MIRRIIYPTAVAAALLVPGVMLTPASGVDPGDLELKGAPVKVSEVKRKLPVSTRFGTGTEPETYLVTLDKDAVPTGDLTGTTAKAYTAELTSQQSTLRQGIAGIVPSAPKVLRTYTHAINGMAVTLTADQARQVAKLPHVRSVTVERIFELTSDAGPEHIKAPQIWNGEATGGLKAKGEGLVVGVVDSGVNPANPSFATTVSEADGGDGYVVKNARGRTYGMCDSTGKFYDARFVCTDKLIGAYRFEVSVKNEVFDDNGHGTHTASTAAGNKVRAVMKAGVGEKQTQIEVPISGVAPHANIISYDACSTSCFESALVASIDQAIKDKVDTINLSIGGASFGALWNDADVVALLNARAAGIAVANSAGNEGPKPYTVSAPAVAPWVLSVGASSHPRRFLSRVSNIKAGAATLPDIDGVAFSPDLAESPLVDMSKVGDEFCAGRATPAKVQGKIAICMRGGPTGSPGRLEKGTRMANLGAVGMILTNDKASGNSTIADTHNNPASLISWEDGQKLRAFVAANPTASASIDSGDRLVDEKFADVMASFSSRGPNVDMMGDTLVPSVVAPGMDILAANGTNNEVSWGLNSGTSMAAPHAAGALTLLKQVHPDWTPAQIDSALMTTAVTGMHEADGSLATAFVEGAGRIDVAKAANSGLLLDVTKQDYLDAQYGGLSTGEPGQLNTASFVEGSCMVSCTWTRTLTGTATGEGVWTVSVESSSPELRLTPSRTKVTLAKGKSVSFALSATLADGAASGVHYGTVVMTPPEGSKAPKAHFPVAVTPAKAQLPGGVLDNTARTTGVVTSAPVTLAASSDSIRPVVAGAVKAQRTSLKFRADSMRDTLFDQPGSQTVFVDVPAGTDQLVAFADSSARTVGMFVGRGAQNMGNVNCSNVPMLDMVMGMTMFGDATPPSCSVKNPKPGRWWITVQNISPSASDAVDTVEVFTANLKNSDAKNVTVVKPEHNSVAGRPFTLDFKYNVPGIKPGEAYLAAVSLSAGSTDYGVVPVAIYKTENALSQTADATTVKPGQKVTYTVSVPPSAPGTALDYDITSTLPKGLTLVPGSATGGATATSGTVSWKNTVGERTPSGMYEYISDVTDSMCRTPLIDTRDWFDLNGIGMQPIKEAVGDNRVWKIASDMKYYGTSGQDLYLTDDGALVYGEAPVPGSTATPQAFPNKANPNNVLAPLWQDMILPEYAVNEEGQQTSGVSILDMRYEAMNDGWLVVQVLGAQLKSDPTQTFDYQVWVKGSGDDFVISYGAMGDVTGASVGSEDAAGESGQSFKKPGESAAGVAKDGIICGHHVAGGKASPVTYTFAATVDATVKPASVLSTVLKHSVNKPGTVTETVTTPVTVAGKAPVTTPTRAASAIALTAPKKVKVGARGKKVTATVKSRGTAATGRVQITVKGAGKKVTRTLPLKAGKVSTALPRYTKKGKVTVTVKYLGSTAAAPAQSVRKITVVRR